jgi:uncharacterized protein with HEPN domain
MLTAAMLGLIEQIGHDIIVLTESLDDHEFFASRLTRMQTLQLLGSLAETARTLPIEIRALMSEVDWTAWDSLPGALAQPTRNSLRIWVAAKEWTPLTLQALSACKRMHPALFRMSASDTGHGGHVAKVI